MVPKIAKAGTSFKAAGKYYLHDKGSNSSERVAFTHTQNMLTDNPQAALKVMAWTAMHQKQLKEKTYRATHPDDPQCQNMNRAGRPTKTTVYHYSLSWHPDETPSKKQMIEAAQETLKVLKLDQHEVLMVAHSDEPQKHIHVIVNKINPETGRVAPLKFTKECLSKWAEEYERQHGKIYCDERVKNNERRRAIEEFAKATGKAPEDIERPKDKKSLNKADYYRWKREQSRQDWQTQKREGDQLREQQKAEHEKLNKDELDAAKQYSSKIMRPHWAALFRKEQAERALLERSFRVSVRNLHNFLRNPKACVQFEGGWLRNAWDGLSSPEQLRKTLEQRQRDERTALVIRHGRLTQKALKKYLGPRAIEIYERQIEPLRERALLEAEQADRQKQRHLQAPQRYQRHLERQQTFDDKARQPEQSVQVRKPEPLSREQREKKEREELAQIFGSYSRAEKAMRKIGNGNQRKENAQSRGKGRSRTRKYDGG